MGGLFGFSGESGAPPSPTWAAPAPSAPRAAAAAPRAGVPAAAAAGAAAAATAEPAAAGGGGGVLGGGHAGASVNAGAGGFGGGGGGGGAGVGENGADVGNGGGGGFGGGGGGGGDAFEIQSSGGGAGGFGGGGGGGVGAGPGGFGGSSGGALGGGGGGLGAGGDIFVQGGASLTISGGSLTGGNVAGGVGADQGFNDGSAFGTGIFLQGNENLVFAPATGQKTIISDVIADETGSLGGGVGATGKASLTLNGAGTLDLAVANSFSGGVTIDQGTLELGNSSAAPGALSFTPGGGGTLLVDAGVTSIYSGIKSFDSSNSFDLTGFNPATTRTIFSNVDGPDLLVTDGVKRLGFLFDSSNPALDFTGKPFYVADDHAGGSIVSLRPALATGQLAVGAPATTTIGVGNAAVIAGVSIAESPTTAGESFTVTLSDNAGVLSANTGAAGGGGTITPPNGGKTLTIAGSLSQVNADLTTLADTDGTTGSDVISVSASDSNGGSAGPASIAVTVNGAPSIGAPANATVAQNVATRISGVSVSETGNTTTSGETFTVVVSDGSGLLTAITAVSGGGGTITSSNSNKTLTIVGTLSQVDADLTTLTDDESSTSAGYAQPLGDRQLRQQRDEDASGDGDAGDHRRSRRNGSDADREYPLQRRDAGELHRFELVNSSLRPPSSH